MTPSDRLHAEEFGQQLLANIHMRIDESVPTKGSKTDLRISDAIRISNNKPEQ